MHESWCDKKQIRTFFGFDVLDESHKMELIETKKGTVADSDHYVTRLTKKKIEIRKMYKTTLCAHTSTEIFLPDHNERKKLDT